MSNAPERHALAWPNVDGWRNAPEHHASAWLSANGWRNAPERHALAWLSADGWRNALAATHARHAEALMQWAGNDWPLVVRRLDADAAPGQVCLGLPLPPDAAGVKVRIPLRVAAADVARTAPATALRDALPEAGDWRGPLQALCDEAAQLDLRVFGSLAMQFLTGLRYRTPASDVDVLFAPASRQQLEQGVALLSRHAVLLPLDGEVIFPGGAGVSWKEWQAAMTHPAKVLVKTSTSVRLADTASLLATLEQH